MGIPTYVPQLRPEFMLDDYFDSEDEGSKKDLSLNEQVTRAPMREEEIPTSFSPSPPLTNSKSVKDEDEKQEEDKKESTTLQAFLHWCRLKMHYLGSCFYGQPPQKKNKKKRQHSSEDFEVNDRWFKQRRVSSSNVA